MHALVLGHRQGLNQALNKLGVPFTLLVDQKLKFPPKTAKIIELEKLNYSKQNLEMISQKLKELDISPTHVIAASEAAVLPATYLRRHLGCRKSVHSVIKKCSLKSEMKTYLSQFKIPMTPFLLSEDVKNNPDLIESLGFPLVEKEVGNSGGRGIRIVSSRDEIEPNTKKRLMYEKLIQGDEGSIESFVQDGKILFTNITEYFDKKYSNILPAGYSDEIKQRILDLNENVIKSLKISWGMTHLEFYLTSHGLLFGEIALRPPGGYIMRLIKESYQIDPWEAFASIELGLDYAFPVEKPVFSGCLIYHPGPGEVSEIKKIEAPSLVQSKIKVNIGDTLDNRTGVGEDVGYSIFSHISLDQLKTDIKKIKNLNPISLRGFND